MYKEIVSVILSSFDLKENHKKEIRARDFKTLAEMVLSENNDL